MTEIRYKFNTTRLINLWFIPTLLTTLFFALFYLKFDRLQYLSYKDIIVWGLIFICFAGVFIFLFINHLQLARQTELIIQGKTFKIIQGVHSYSGDLSTIKEIIQYSTGRLPWSSIIKWKIKTGDREFVISSLTISKLNFERHFNNKIKDKTSFMPIL